MVNTSKIISVLMPARNSQESIRKAIASTLRALPRKSELLIVDDESQDNTYDIAANYPDDRVRAFRNTENRGVASSLNFLLEQSKGQIVARMDSDDICLPWRFANVAKAIDDNDFIFGSHLIYDSRKSRLSSNMPIHLGHKAIVASLLIENPISHITMNCKRSSLEKLNGYSNTPAEDYDLWLRAAKNFKLVKYATPVAIYRQHSTQSTAQSALWRRRALTSENLQNSYSELCQSLGVQMTGWHKNWSQGIESSSTELRGLVSFLLKEMEEISFLETISVKRRFQRIFGYQLP